MIALIAGCSHTGKTLLAQRLLEKYHYPSLSIDHLKMGLIRSGQTRLTPESSDDLLTDYLWPIVREIIKTAVENGQNLIIEGGYIPFNWQEDFTDEYLKSIRYLCLIMTEEYIDRQYQLITEYADVIEKRRDDSWMTSDAFKEENIRNLRQCKKYGCGYVIIDDDYSVDFPLD